MSGAFNDRLGTQIITSNYYNYNDFFSLYGTFNINFKKKKKTIECNAIIIRMNNCD